MKRTQSILISCKIRTNVLHSSHEVVELCERIGISYNTAWRMWKRGQIPGYQLPTSTVIIDPPELRSTPEHMVAVYARVSSSENKKKLDTQAE